MNEVLRHLASAVAGGAAVLLFFLAAGESDRSGTDEVPAAPRAGGEGPAAEDPRADLEGQSRALEDLRAENATLAERGRRLETELAAARVDLEKTRQEEGTPPGAGPEARTAAPVARTDRPGGSPRTGDPAGDGSGEGPEALPRMKRYVVFGEGLTDQAVEKLGLDEDERESVESAIAGEEQRLHAALDLYARETEGVEGPRPGESTPALLSRLLQASGIVESMTRFHEENPDAMNMLREGKISLAEILGEDSDAYRLLSALRENRRQTHEDVASILDPERALLFAEEIHPAGMYSFKGNLNLALMGPVTPEDAAEAAARREGKK